MERITFLQSAQQHLKMACEMEQARRVNDAAVAARDAVRDIQYWFTMALDDNRATENNHE